MLASAVGSVRGTMHQLQVPWPMLLRYHAPAAVRNFKLYIKNLENVAEERGGYVF